MTVPTLKAERRTFLSFDATTALISLNVNVFEARTAFTSSGTSPSPFIAGVPVASVARQATACKVIIELILKCLTHEQAIRLPSLGFLVRHAQRYRARP